MLSNRSRLIVPAILGFAIASSPGSPARASFIVNVVESGGNVVASGSGTLNTTDLAGPGIGTAGAELNGAISYALFGPSSPVTINYYSGVSGPIAFGTTNGTFLADIGNGDLVGVTGSLSFLWVPQDYVSGSLLNSSDTWSGQTFATLGLTPGTYTWTWGTGADADFFTMNIVGSSSVPEPAGIALFGMGSLAILGCAQRRRRAA
jgi:hypothetical protein